MPSGPYRECFECGREISEFENEKSYMRCPKAEEQDNVIGSLMPSYPSQVLCSKAIEMLERGGYKVTTVHQLGNAWWPHLVIIADLARRLMQYESVEGARFHKSRYLCEACVEKQGACCASCGRPQAPTCSICGAVLVPVSCRSI
jgi:hypothetical protein